MSGSKIRSGRKTGWARGAQGHPSVAAGVRPRGRFAKPDRMDDTDKLGCGPGKGTLTSGTAPRLSAAWDHTPGVTATASKDPATTGGHATPSVATPSVAGFPGRACVGSTFLGRTLRGNPWCTSHRSASSIQEPAARASLSPNGFAKRHYIKCELKRVHCVGKARCGEGDGVCGVKHVRGKKSKRGGGKHSRA